MANIKTYNHNLWDHGISQAYSVNGTIYISGQFSHDSGGAFVGEGDIETQTRQTLKNLDHVLAEFGATKCDPRMWKFFWQMPGHMLMPSLSCLRNTWGIIARRVRLWGCRTLLSRHS